MASNWRRAELADLDVLLSIVKDFYQLWGRWPTPEELRALLVGH